MSGSFIDAVGDVQEATWTATATCPSGPCDVNILSGGGRQYDFTYADGTWTHDGPSTLPCLDGVTGEPTGEVVPITSHVVLSPAAGVDPSSETPILALSGTFTETADTGCDGLPAMTTQDVQATRVGD